MSKENNLENVLLVRMLGSFSIMWNGKLIAGGSKASDSQFTSLLQILIHNRKTGVSRDRLEELLFGDRDIDNVHHALQSVIYNSKKKLERAGLPKVNFIEQNKGVFFWTEELPVEEDAAIFEELYQAAEAAVNKEIKLQLYQEACYKYGGEFLPMQTSTIWVAREARHYEELFDSCVEKAVSLMRETEDFMEMKDLGLYAAQISPLSDWEVVTMEAMISMRQYEEAYQLYERTVELYLNEQGLRPSKKLMEQFGRLGDEMKFEHSALQDIQDGLEEEDPEAHGGFMCTYPVFQGIYQMIKRMLERGGQSVFLMLCTIVDGKGNPMRESSMLDELSGRMVEAIRLSIRRGDAMSLYGRGQCLVLLVNTTRENCSIVQRRINQRFIIGRQRSGIEYYVNSVFWMPS